MQLSSDATTLNYLLARFATFAVGRMRTLTQCVVAIKADGVPTLCTRPVHVE